MNFDPIYLFWVLLLWSALDILRIVYKLGSPMGVMTPLNFWKAVAFWLVVLAAWVFNPVGWIFHLLGGCTTIAILMLALNSPNSLHKPIKRANGHEPAIYEHRDIFNALLGFLWLLAAVWQAIP